MTVRNKAAEELSRLTQAAQKPLKAAQQVESLRDTRDASGLTRAALERSGGEAGFALPEALVTAVGGAFLLGPVGGILLGVGQGILGKEAKQNALDQFASQSKVFDNTSDAISMQLDRYAAQARTPEDLAVIDALQTQAGTALDMMRTPGLQEKGGALLEDFYDKMNSYASTNEEQRIADEQYRQELERNIGKDQLALYDGMISRFENQSADYETIIGSTNTALSALDGGSPAQISGAATLVAKALDPRGVVRPEDEAKWTTLGNLRDKLLAIAEKTIGDGGTTVTQRNDMKTIIDDIRREANKIQLSRESRFLNEAIDKELPTNLLDNFTLVDKLDQNANVPLPEEKSTGERVIETVTGTDESGQSWFDRAIEADRRRVTDALEAVFGLPGNEEAERPVRFGRTRLPTN